MAVEFTFWLLTDNNSQWVVVSLLPSEYISWLYYNNNLTLKVALYIFIHRIRYKNVSIAIRFFPSDKNQWKNSHFCWLLGETSGWSSSVYIVIWWSTKQNRWAHLEIICFENPYPKLYNCRDMSYYFGKKFAIFLLNLNFSYTCVISFN